MLFIQPTNHPSIHHRLSAISNPPRLVSNFLVSFCFPNYKVFIDLKMDDRQMTDHPSIHPPIQGYHSFNMVFINAMSHSFTYSELSGLPTDVLEHEIEL
jgi:hypothetical protein